MFPNNFNTNNNPYSNNPYSNNPYSNNPYSNNPYSNNPYSNNANQIHQNQNQYNYISNTNINFHNAQTRFNNELEFQRTNTPATHLQNRIITFPHETPVADVELIFNINTQQLEPIRVNNPNVIQYSQQNRWAIQENNNNNNAYNNPIDVDLVITTQPKENNNNTTELNWNNVTPNIPTSTNKNIQPVIYNNFEEPTWYMLTPGTSASQNQRRIIQNVKKTPSQTPLTTPAPIQPNQTASQINREFIVVDPSNPKQRSTIRPRKPLPPYCSQFQLDVTQPTSTQVTNQNASSVEKMEISYILNEENTNPENTRLEKMKMSFLLN